MKTLLNQAIVVLLLSVITLASCNKEKPINPDPPLTNEVTHADINKWVLDSMRLWYYWTDHIPASPNMNAAPLQFFESILKRPDDRFSWMQNNQELRDQLAGISTMTSGMSVGWIGLGEYAAAVVRLVHLNSPAEKAGVKRGDIFTRVNGQRFNLSGNQVTNAGMLLRPSGPLTLTYGHLNGNVISEGQDISVTPVETFQETAILLDTVLVTPNNTKVGYLFYNRFLQNQAQGLVDAFKRFKAAGVSELIIDERYNSGGSVGVAAILSGLIHKNFNGSDPYIQYHFNNRVGGTMVLRYEDLIGKNNIPIIQANNLGLDRVFILATSQSASASELLINNLKPFIGQVVHIGGTTVGKDDASVTFSNSDTARFKGEHDWGIQPIILKYANRDGGGNFVNGLEPNYTVSEQAPYYQPLGSSDDPLLGKALSLIDPSLQAKYGLRMSLQRDRLSRLPMNELEEFNQQQQPYRPLDVTETLRGGKMLPFDLK